MCENLVSSLRDSDLVPLRPRTHVRRTAEAVIRAKALTYVNSARRGGLILRSSIPLGMPKTSSHTHSFSRQEFANDAQGPPQLGPFV